MELLIKTPVGTIPKSQLIETFQKEGLEVTSENCLALECEFEIWEASADKSKERNPEVRRKTLGEVLAEVKDFLPHYLGAKDIDMVLDYLVGNNLPQINAKEDPLVKEFPSHCWLACYVVTGDSEGHFIHVDAIGSSGGREGVFMGKTFLGAQKAWEVAQACAIILQA